MYFTFDLILSLAFVKTKNSEITLSGDIRKLSIQSLFIFHQGAM